MQHRNNQLVVCSGLILTFVCALAVKWFSIEKATREGSIFLSVNGFEGSITLLFTVPIWLLLTCSAFFMVVVTTNVLELTSVRWLVLAVGLLLPGVHYLSLLLARNGLLVLAIGPMLALVATLFALVFVFAQATATRPEVDAPVAATTHLWR